MPESQRATVVPTEATAAARKERRCGTRRRVAEEEGAGEGGEARGWVESGRRREERGGSAPRVRERRAREADMAARWVGWASVMELRY
jgi:hypothetical protein